MNFNKLCGCFAPLLILAFAVGGCSVNKLSRRPVASIQGSPGHHLVGQIIHLESGKVLPFEELIDQLKTKQLVFIGEVHNNPDHHLMEVQLLQALTAKQGFKTVAMEFFEHPQQPVLERYLRGSSTEGEFLEEVNWRKTWGFDYHFYRPLVEEAKECGGEIVAINAPRDVIKKVARSGLESLSPEDRGQLASEIDLTDGRHREFVRDAYAEHSRGELDDFEHFYQAQCAWEDTMAENIARSLEKGKKVIVFAGNGHIMEKFGIPDRTVKRAPVPMATVVLYPLGRPAFIGRGTADYVWLSRDCK